MTLLNLENVGKIHDSSKPSHTHIQILLSDTSAIIVTMCDLAADVGKFVTKFVATPLRYFNETTVPSSKKRDEIFSM